MDLALHSHNTIQLRKRSLIYGKMYPFIETSLGIMFLFRWQIKTALIITLVILSITTIGLLIPFLTKGKLTVHVLGQQLNYQ